MEFSSRGFQRNTSAPAPAAGTHGAPAPSSPGRKKAMQRFKESKSFMVLWVIFFASITVLVVALILSLSTKTQADESALISEDKYQAVFLNNGQAYFGKIKSINNDYTDLRDIYYLYNGSTNSTDSTAANLSLVKLGTELHCPQDRMVIYRDQISFWENLQSDGKVATAIKEWKANNKDGVKCSAATTQQSSQQGTSPQQTSTDSSTPAANTPSTSNNTTNKPSTTP